MAYSTELRNAILDAKNAVIGNGGKLEIYAGADSAGTNNAEGTLLAVFTLGSPFAPAAVNGVQSPTLPADTTAVASGAAGWARVTKADGTTAVMDLTVGTSGAQVTLSTLSVTAGGALSVTGWTVTAGNA